MAKRTKQVAPPPADTSLARVIRGKHLNRRFAMTSQQVLDRRLESFVRMTLTDWHPDDDEKAREKANKEVRRLIDVARAEPEDNLSMLGKLVRATESARKPFDEVRKENENELRKLARELPYWTWAATVRGFGDLNLASIVGEANDDIANYRTVSGLWKRFGLAVIGGERQRKVKDAELAVLHGYSPSRRAVAFNLSECIVKAGGPYADLYRARKAIEVPRVKTKMHAHNRAARYMVKRLLMDLWRVAHGMPAREIVSSDTDVAALDHTHVDTHVLDVERSAPSEIDGSDAAESPANAHPSPTDLAPGSPIPRTRKRKPAARPANGGPSPMISTPGKRRSAKTTSSPRSRAPTATPRNV